MRKSLTLALALVTVLTVVPSTMAAPRNPNAQPTAVRDRNPEDITVLKVVQKYLKRFFNVGALSDVTLPIPAVAHD